MQSTNKQSEIFQEYYTENTNLFIVYVNDKKPVYKRLKEKDKREYNAGDKTIVKGYFPSNSIDRPYTFIRAVEESEVEVILLEQYQTINFFIECFSIAI
jgi:hypothetical protein